MVTTNYAIHLDEQQLLRAIVNAEDLPVTVQKHLTECSRCRVQKENAERELTTLGMLAERFAPSPTHAIVLPAKPRLRFGRWISLNWQAAAGMAVAVAAIFLVVWNSHLLKEFQKGPPPNTAQAMLEAEQLMTAIDRLVENPLPSEYLAITGEDVSEVDDEFIRFLIPVDDSEPFVSRPWEKGSAPC